MNSIQTESCNTMNHYQLMQAAALSVLNSESCTDAQIALLNKIVGTTKATWKDLECTSMVLSEKDAVMESMHIIPAAICAAYLAVPIDAIYRFKKKIGAIFGGTYFQALCFSMKELELFAENYGWFFTEQGAYYPPPHSYPTKDFLLEGSLVGLDVFMGYLAVKGTCTMGTFDWTTPLRRVYRLSDIRQEFMSRFPVHAAQSQMNAMVEKLPTPAVLTVSDLAAKSACDTKSMHSIYDQQVSN